MAGRGDDLTEGGAIATEPHPDTSGRLKIFQSFKYSWTFS
jgi:hypothetical protein